MEPQRLHLRLDSVNHVHIRETLFFNGANCGQLCFNHGEYQIFGAALLLGAEQTRGNLEVTTDKIAHDENGEFCMPTSAVKPKA